MASKSELLEIIQRASKSSSEVPATGLGFGTAVQLGLCLATELGELHRRGEFHGRISPQAIHLVAQRAEWVDWEAVAEPHECFVAPEFADDTISGTELDIFGYGATMAALLLGRRPTYSDTGDLEIYGRGIDIGLANVCDAATAPDRLDRFESMDDVIVEITRLAQRAGLGAAAAAPTDMALAAEPRQFPLPRAARASSALAAAAVAASATRRWIGQATSALNEWSARRAPIRHEQDVRRRQAWAGLGVLATLVLAVMIVRTADTDVGDFSKLNQSATGGNGAAGIAIDVREREPIDGPIETTADRSPTSTQTPAVPITAAPAAGPVGVRSPVSPANPGTAPTPRPTTAPPPASVPRQPPVPTTSTPRSTPTTPVPRSSVPPPVSPNPRIVNPAPSTTVARAILPPPPPPAPTNPPSPVTTTVPPTTLPSPPPPVTVDALKPPPPGVPTTVDAVVHWTGPPTTIDAVRRP